MSWIHRIVLMPVAVCVVLIAAGDGQAEDAPPRVAFFAGPASHNYGAHEHPAGCKLLAEQLNAWGKVRAEVIENKWPGLDDPRLKNIRALIVFSDGLKQHPLNGRYADVDQLAERGVNIGYLHYTLIPNAKDDYPHFLRSIGGYYEPHWSTNPVWHAKFEKLPTHPITRGVRPFEMQDEWYYHMRFNAKMKGVTPLLTATPPDATRKRDPGPHSGNPHIAARLGMPEHLAWAYQSPEGRRGFGFTGLHWHWNLAHDDYRTFLLNASAWLAGVEAPKAGVPSKTPTLDELIQLIGRPVERWNRDKFEKLVKQWNQRD